MMASSEFFSVLEPSLTAGGREGFRNPLGPEVLENCVTPPLQPQCFDGLEECFWESPYTMAFNHLLYARLTWLELHFFVLEIL